MHLSFSSKHYQPEMSFIEKKHLLGLLLSYAGLIHVALQHNLPLQTSGQLDKNKDQRKNREVFSENIKFLLNLYEM